MMKRWLLFACIPLMLIGGVLYFAPTIKQMMVGWYLKGYSQKYFRHRLAFDRLVTKENGDFLLEGVHLEPVDGGYLVEADEVSIDYTLSLRKRTIDAALTVKGPHIALKEGKPHASSKKKASINRPYFLLHPKVSFSIQDGAITKDGEQLFGFLVEGELQSSPEAMFSAHLECTAPSEKRVLVEYEQKEEEKRWSFSGEGEIDHFYPALMTFFPVCTAWNLQGGHFSGQGKGVLLDGDHWEIKGQVVGEEVSLPFRQAGLVLALGDVSIDLTSELLDGEWFFAKMQYQRGDIEFDGEKKLTDLKGEGKISFQGLSDLKAEGKVIAGERSLPLFVQGQAWIEEVDELSLSFEGKVGPKQKDSSFQFVYQKCGCEMSHLAFSCDSMDASLFSVMSGSLSHRYMEIPDIRPLSGLLALDLDIEQSGSKTTFSLLDFRGERVRARYCDSFVGQARSLVFAGEWVYSQEEGWEETHCNGEVEEGKGLIVDPEGQRWEVLAFDARYLVEDGVILPSSHIQLAMEDVDLSVALSEEEGIAPFRLRVEGKMDAMWKKLPKEMQGEVFHSWGQELVSHWKDSPCLLTAEIYQDDDFLHVEGAAHLFTSPENKDRLEFSFECPFLTPWKSNYRPLEGYLRASGVALDHYIPQSLRFSDKMRIEGTADFLLSYEAGEPLLYYSLADVYIQHPQFEVSVPSLMQKDQLPSRFSGYQDVILLSRENPFLSHSFLVCQGRIDHPSSGLSFTDIQGEVEIGVGGINCPQLEGFLDRVFIQTALYVDLSNAEEGTVVLDLFGKNIQAEISDVVEIFAPFESVPSVFQVPIKGTVLVRDEEAEMQIYWTESGCEVDAFISGVVSDGKMDGSGVDLSFHDLNFQFSYDHKKSALTLSDIQGSALVGDPDDVSVYTLIAETITFPSRNKEDGSFDCWIGDRSRDLIRLTGLITQDPTDKKLTYTFDPKLTHLGCIHPKEGRVSFSHQGAFDQLHLTVDVPLKDSLKELKFLTSLGLVAVPRGLRKGLNTVEDAKGLLSIVLDKTAEDAPLYFNILGEEVSLGGNPIHKFALVGDKQGKDWSIERCQVDAIVLAVDLIEEPDRIDVPFFGLQVGESFLIGSEGAYDVQKQKLDVSLNLAELEWVHLIDFPPLRSFVEQYTPQGEMKAKGSFQVTFLDEAPWWKAKAVLNTSIRNFSFCDLSFGDCDGVVIVYDSTDGLKVQDLKTTFIRGNSSPVPMSIKAFGYNTQSDHLWLEGVQFAVNRSDIFPCVMELRDHFSSDFPSQYLSIIGKAYADPVLEGELDLYHEKGGTSIHLTLDQGMYHFSGQEYLIQSLELWGDPLEVQLKGKTKIWNEEVSVVVRSAMPQLSFGESVVTALNPVTPSYAPLLILWETTPEGGWTIPQVNGQLGPFTLSLSGGEPDQSGTIHLQGRVLMEGEDLLSLAPFYRTKDFLTDSSPEESCLLRGEWTINTRTWDQWTFDGTVQGKQVPIASKRWDHFFAKLHATKEKMDVSQLVMQGDGGVVEMDTATFYHKGRKDWSFTIPKLSVKNLSPYFLHKGVGVAPVLVDQFYFESVQLNGLQGTFRPTLSLYGKGQLQFAQSPRYKQLALDRPFKDTPEMGMTPICGEVTFSFEGDKIVVTDMQDIFSERRLLRYYLSKDLTSSIGLDGTLDLHLSVQPYHALTTLSDLFTITIVGTVDDPDVSYPKGGVFKRE